MNGLFELIAACGILLIAAGSVLLCIYAFRQSILWGVLCLLVPFALPIFAILHLREAKIPILIWTTGVLIVGILAAIAIATTH